MAVCPNCGNQVGENAIFCDQCGARLAPSAPAAPPPSAAPAGGSVICPTCGAGNVPGEAFCDTCGSPLAAPEPAPAPAAPEPAAPPAPAAPVEQKPTCPACQGEILPGEAFCANCGASLAQPPIPPEPVAEAVPPPVPEVVAPAPEAVAPPAPEVVPAVPEVLALPVVPEVVALPPAPVATNCPVCGTPAEPGDAFCSSCGAALQAAPPAAPEPVAPAVPAAPAAPAPALVGPRLVIVASGAEIPLPAKAEILMGREDPVSGIFPEVDMTPHGGEDGGVSRRHARLLFEGGRYFLEDLDSTNYSFVNKQKLVPHTRQPLSDGDGIRLGRVEMVLRL